MKQKATAWGVGGGIFLILSAIWLSGYVHIVHYTSDGTVCSPYEFVDYHGVYIGSGWGGCGSNSQAPMVPAWAYRPVHLGRGAHWRVYFGRPDGWWWPPVWRQ
jgi:hypothetical protein